MRERGTSAVGGSGGGFVSPHVFFRKKLGLRGMLCVTLETRGGGRIFLFLQNEAFARKFGGFPAGSSRSAA